MQFSTSLKEKMEQYKNQEKSYTENGAVAYATSGKELLDFNFNITSMRTWRWPAIKEDFAKVFYENPTVAVKYWFYCMDCREGLGERNISKGIMKWMVDNHPEIIEKVYKFISEYNRWDTLILLADPQFNTNKELRKTIVEWIKIHFIYDIMHAYDEESISLLGKWMPSENASSKETKRMARQLMQDINITPRNYRRCLSALRRKLNVVECNMSANNWDEINYEAVPSKANLNYSKAFMRHDEERRKEYLDSLKNGEAKINAKVLAPYEICHSYGGSYGYGVKPYDEALELMWKALPKYQMNDVLVVRDGSGSMTDRVSGEVTCLDVATSLAIYAAEHNSKNWYNKFITFSSRPEFIDMGHCKSLRDKIMYCSTFNDCSNTDIYKTMKLILNTAVSKRYKQEELPKTILIISDMQFDADGRSYWSSYSTNKHGSFNYDKTLFETIQAEYERFGYKLPKIVFWNVDSRGNKTIPVQQNDCGLILCSGFSANIFKMLLGNEFDPYQALLKILNSERYQPIEKALQAD